MMRVPAPFLLLQFLFQSLKKKMTGKKKLMEMEKKKTTGKSRSLLTGFITIIVTSFPIWANTMKKNCRPGKNRLKAGRWWICLPTPQGFLPGLLRGQGLA
jgi:hypothetical protein